MAGLIASQNANYPGLAPAAKILPVRAISWAGGTAADISASITWASGGSVATVASNPNVAQIINLSFAMRGECSAILQDAISGAIARGSVVIAAAGNAATHLSGFAPANCDGVISVAALDQLGRPASYTNSGALVAEFGGTRTAGAQSASNTGSTGPLEATNSTQFGTSVAAARMSAQAAVLLSQNPEWGSEMLRANLAVRHAAPSVDDPAAVPAALTEAELAQIETLYAFSSLKM